MPNRPTDKRLISSRPIRFRTLAFSIAAAALALGGCAGPGPVLTGNDTGGIVAWSPVAHREAPRWAADHCARYGKVAAKSAEIRGYGNYISFRCNWDRRAYRRH
jgi:hypothetical protein